MRISDWSSDVCSSDLQADRQKAGEHHQHQSGVEAPETHLHQAVVQAQVRANVAQHQKSDAQREEAVDAKQRRMGMDRRGVQSLTLEKRYRRIYQEAAYAGAQYVPEGNSDEAQKSPYHSDHPSIARARHTNLQRPHAQQEPHAQQPRAQKP